MSRRPNIPSLKLPATPKAPPQKEQAAVLIQQGLALHQQGKLAETEEIYHRVLKISPNNFDALQLLGALTAQTKQYAKAVDFLTTALIINPHHPEALNNRGFSLKELGRIEEAIISYDKAIEIRADFADAHFNRGIALQEMKRSEEAVVSYDKAISAKPDYASALINRGAALKALGRLEEAIASYDKIISIKPDFAEAYFNRGVILQELKRFDEAIDFYDKAININPDFSEVYYNRGKALQQLSRLIDARISLTKSLELNPSNDNCRWSIPFTSIPILLPEAADLATLRETFLTELQELDRWYTGDKLKNAYNLVGSDQPFYLAYQELNNRNLLYQYGQFTSRLMNHWQQENNLQVNIQTKSDKVIVGIIGEHIRNHSVWNAITKGFLLNLDSNKFEVHIFHLGAARDKETELAQKKASSYTNNQSSLLDWSKAILDKKIEVLIYPEIGMEPLTTQLANLRLAPIQMAMWGHPETTGLPTIDYYISAELFETPSSENAYTEKLIRLPNLGCSYSRLPVTAINIDLHKLGLDINQPILLCPGTTHKYAPENDWVLVEIIKRLGKCKLVFFNQNTGWTKILSERLRKTFADANIIFDEHIVFAPWLTPGEFYGLMGQADVFLDTIGFSGFNTAIQAIDCALPIVTKEGEFMRGRLASGILNRIGIPELIAKTDEEYITLAVKLAQDKAYRNQMSQKITQSRDILYDDMDPIRALENFLLKTRS